MQHVTAGRTHLLPQLLQHAGDGLRALRLAGQGGVHRHAAAGARGLEHGRELQQALRKAAGSGAAAAQGRLSQRGMGLANQGLANQPAGQPPCLPTWP